MQPAQPQVSTVANTNMPQQSTGPSKLLIILIVFLFFLLLGVIILLVRAITSQKSQKTEQQQKTTVQEVNNKFPYQILQQDKNDKVGRTVIYKGRIKVDENRRQATEGVGWKITGSTKKQGASYRYAITGFFEKREHIKDSADYYIVLSVPGEEEPIKIRILNEHFKKLQDTSLQTVTTLLSVENLDKVAFNNKNPLEGEDNLGNMKYVLEDDFDKLFAKNDVVTLVFMRPPNMYTPLVDEAGNPVARTISIRRFGGAKEIEKEVYHSYPIKPTE